MIARLVQHHEGLQVRRKLERGHAGLAEPLVETVEIGLDAARVGLAAVAEQVCAHYIGYVPPEHGARAALDLDRLHAGKVEEPAVAVGDLLLDAGAVDLDLDAVAADAANGERAEIAERIGSRRLPGDVDARLVAHEVLRVPHLMIVELLPRYHGHRARHLEHLGRLSRRRDRDFLEIGRVLRDRRLLLTVAFAFGRLSDRSVGKRAHDGARRDARGAG